MQSLRTYLKSNGVKHRDFAEAIGISEGYLSQLINNQRTPSLDIALRIQAATENHVLLSSLIQRSTSRATLPNRHGVDCRSPQSNGVADA